MSLSLAEPFITTLTVLVGLALLLVVYRMSTLVTLGAICACMTNPPGLAAASNHTTTGLPALAYASV